MTDATPGLFDEPLESLDPTADRFIRLERRRQHEHLILIASESICPRPVREALASEFGNIYAEGYPSTRMSEWERATLADHERGLAFYRRYADRRYYKGTEYCDFIETLAQTRAAKMFATDTVPAGAIYANVQPLSGAAANNAVYEAFCEPGDTVMGIELSHGGHLTHGSPFNRSGKRYRIVSYGVDEKTGRIDYDQVIDLARREKPRLIIGGASAYPWAFDWEALRRAADAAGDAVLLADVAHPAGLIVAGQYPNPIGHAHVVSSTTHKTLCGPRGALILTTDPAYRDRIDMAVFPGEQGGPHLHTIAGKAVAFGIALTPEFRALGKRVKDNAAALANALVKRGAALVYGGTDSHLLLLDCKRLPRTDGGGGGDLNGDIASRILDLVGITANKNTVAGDTSAANPSGVRFGTTWVSQLGMGLAEMDDIAACIVDTLSATHPFDVTGAFGRLGRGKLPLDVLEGVRARVQSLIARFPNPELSARVKDDETILVGERRRHPAADLLAARGAVFGNLASDRPHVPLHFGNAEAEARAAIAGEGACLFDLSANGLVELRGGRARSMLQQVCTADLHGLEPGHAARTFLLKGDGAVLSDAVIYRLPAGARGRSRYWLRTPFDTGPHVVTWLRGLCDGYIFFDTTAESEGDPFRKIDGPVAIADRRSARGDAPPLATYYVIGKQAPDVLRRVVPATLDQLAGSIREHEIAGESVWVARATDTRFSLTGDRATAEIWLRKLIEAGGDTLELCGLQALDALRQHDVLPGAAPKEALPELLAKHPSRFAPAKSYFIGQPAIVEVAEPAPRTVRFAWDEVEVTDDDKLKRSCLYDEHLKLTKARNLVPFAGWKMPVMYTTISNEHRAVREGAGLFDVSHMGVFEIAGPYAQPLLDLVATNFVLRLRPGQSTYSYLLGPDGGCLDDVLVYCRAPERYMLVVNAANADKDWAWLNAVNERDVILDGRHPWRGLAGTGRAKLVNLKEDPAAGDERRADIALQGRTSLAILQSLTDDAGVKFALETLKRTDFIDVTLAGHPVIVARTGYTGEEIGFELYAHPDRTPDIWNAILARTELNVKPTGLGARDSTRTEAGFPLYGHELAGPHDVDPAEAGYAAFVKLHKPFFVGRDPYLARMQARSREVVRFRLARPGVRTVHPGAPVVNPRGRVIGFVTSCTLVGARQIGLALIDRQQVRDGARIGLFIPPRKDAAMPPIGKLALGDQVTLHEEAVLLCRFPESPAELGSNLAD